ncbi:hypothetical protein DQK32_25060 [Salmonella enterica subsp. enterica serovar Newport]|uniref:Uncharacterized protein n=2 Tax=Salmonella enterica TaxID=28901 RepID=A0A5T2WNB3_SALER|nr:hypothetical protein [Salmonella enterica subsp. enterica serovar Newport]EAM8419940.1 hypothetical protein [Salmonella enterica]EBN2842843.1 hypothetical protein [Salmonella enterica]EBS4549104.1 hypothetical protein [Salmonella enterica subsp. enterica serovar Newport]EBX6585368.1 hypothetical protein [Salmonella enterica subsp. enterica serovar Newport]
MKKNIRDHDIEGQYRTVSNPYIAVPLTAIFKLRACTEVRAFCLYVTRPLPDGGTVHGRLIRST